YCGINVALHRLSVATRFSRVDRPKVEGICKGTVTPLQRAEPAERSMQVPETSYSSEGGGFLDLLQQARHLVQGRSDIHKQVADVLARVRKLERWTDEKLGLKLEGLEMLDVGAGQLLLQMRYF